MARNKNELRSAGELPRWFDRSKYDKASELDAKGWHYQLTLRSDAFSCLSFDPSRVHPQTPEAIEELKLSSAEGFKCIVNLLRLDPVPPVIKTFGEAWLEEFFGPTFQPAIHSMTVEELMRHERHLADGRKTYARRWIDQFNFTFGERKPFVYKRKRWLSRPLYESNGCRLLTSVEETRASRTPGFEVAVNVSLRHSDAFLLESFKEWLKKVRSVEQFEMVNKRFRQQEIASWVKYNVLAFLDLQLWAQEEGVSIPHRVMADAIFKPWEMDAETIRKTVSPLAWSLITEPEDGGGSARAWLAAQEG